MTEERVKLIKSDNTEEEYLVLLDHELGRGGFGTVYRAVDPKHREQKLVVKVVPLENSRREAVERQLMILRQLPIHPNLVRILPIKCYSENNYYILMEYCKNGTLLDLMKKRVDLSEAEVFDIFYQLIHGYKILYDKKILHQDLKPQNILVHNGRYKLADFGLSIFYESYKFTNKRQGTLNYIAPEKLTKLEYKGNPASDIYSLAIILFELVVGRHPYIRQQNVKRQLKSFVQQLKQAKLTLPMGFSNNHSLKFLQWFDLLLRMVSKTEVDRPKFDEIFKYIQSSETFEKQRNEQREKSRQHQISQYNLIVSEVSKVLTVPIGVTQEEQNEIRVKCESGRKIERESQDDTLVSTLFDFVVSRRILIYFMDRLARRLIVEQMLRLNHSVHYDNAIFQLMLVNRSLIHLLVQQVRNPKYFTAVDWKKLKQDPQKGIILQIIQKDQGYIEDETCDFLAGETLLSKKQLNEIFDIYRSGDLRKQLHHLHQALQNLYLQKCKYIEASRKQLTTLVFLEESMEVVAKLPDKLDDWCVLEQFIREIEISSVDKLRLRVQKSCNSRQLQPMIEIPDQIEQEPLMN